nr:integrase, catalytic region, zinc finger, CCHC-type, peptidase aspartic, catalytic [Tanacetum cinerariifolium]
KDNVIRQLKKKLSQLQVTRSDTDRTFQVQTTDSQIPKLTDHVTNLQAQNDLFRAENDKIKQHYKDLNNRDAHLDYLRHLKESVETIRDIVEEAKVVRPLDRSIVSACRYTKHSQELLEYAIGTCPQGSQQRAKLLSYIPLIRKKQVTVAKPSDKSDKVVATACYTQNQSLIYTRHHKTPYELVHNKKPDLTFFRVFGALCYLTNDSEDLGKLQPTADTGIFVGYALSRKGYRIYNKRTWGIMETIHV